MAPRPARAAAALVVVLALLAAGCRERPPSDGPVTLVFKHAKILGPADPVPGLLRRFEAEHPGVRVVSEALTWSSDEQHQFYVINLEGGSPPFDVMMLDVIWVPEFARAGWILDLTPLVSAAERDAHFASAIEPAVQDGRLWALPWFMNVGLLYYRKDLLAKYGLAPPRTYDELIRQVRLVQAGERDRRLDGYLWQGKQYEGGMVNVLEALWANGTRLLDEAGRPFPEPERARESLAFLRDLIVSGVSPSWVTAGDEELTRRPFGDGRAIFLRSWPYALDLFELPDSRVRGRVGVAPLPALPHGPAGAASTGGAHLAVSARTRHPALAVELVRFLTGEAAQRAMTEGAALRPSRPALFADPGLIARDPTLPALLPLIRAGHPRPVTPYYLMLSTTLQPEFSAVLVGRKSPERAIRDGAAQVEHLQQALTR
ncbi:MAG TPA: ABC transporter substrate-binding protein [Verrucomicrobiae bacterium]|jgi:trehalose/maltose transport system substrate-binding protein|nr:ABC transporter substrate-binding protein [Verrucomicrobiae bacterium]